MDGINWSGLSQSRNVFADLAQGLRYGSDLRKERQKADQEAARTRALNLFSTDPRGAETALMSAGDIETAELLRKRREFEEASKRRANAAELVGKGDYRGAQQAALSGGDFDMAKSIAGLDIDQRKAARERAQDLGGFALGIKGLPYDQRRSVIQQAASILQQQGFTEEQIAGFDPTDANLQALAAQAMDLKTALEEADRQADNARADRQADETQRHNRASEATAAQNASTSASNAARGWAAHNERRRSGGYGTPGVGRDLGATLSEDY